MPFSPKPVISVGRRSRRLLIVPSQGLEHITRMHAPLKTKYDGAYAPGVLIFEGCDGFAHELALTEDEGAGVGPGAVAGTGGGSGGARPGAGAAGRGGGCGGGGGGRGRYFWGKLWELRQIARTFRLVKGCLPGGKRFGPKRLRPKREWAFWKTIHSVLGKLFELRAT